MDSVNITVTKNNTYPHNNNKVRNTVLTCAGVAVGWESEFLIRKALGTPLHKYIKKELIKSHDPRFKKYVEIAIKQNNLNDGFKILDLNPKTVTDVMEKLDEKLVPPTKIQKFFGHILRLPFGKNIKVFNDTLKGTQAFFSPYNNAVVCNFDKFGAPLFHEITHKLNATSSNPLIKTLATIRSPLAIIGPTIISAMAVLTDPKEKNGEDKKGFLGFLKKHCGLLAASAMLPLTIEEYIANVKGTEVAKKAGVSGEMLKTVKQVHKMSMISYTANLLIVGIGAHFASKIRDYICSKRKNDVTAITVQNNNYHVHSEKYNSNLNGFNKSM